MDTETQKIYSEGESVSNFVHDRGWKIVKDIFVNKITDLQSIKNLDLSTATKMTQDVKVRLLAVDILMEIIREVEGLADQHQANIPLMDDKKLEII